MEAFDRRKVLTGAVLGGAALVGATAFGSVEAAHAHETSASLDDALDPNFVDGRITAINGTTLTVIGLQNLLTQIRITDATSVWKLRPTTVKSVDVGDGLYARGARMADGSLAADAVWVNIVNLHAELTSMGPGVLHLRYGHGYLRGHVVPGTTSAVYGTEPATVDLSRLRVGSHIQFIGAWRPDTDDVDIATIFAAS
jgi:hypothetical protein